jgi:xanthosine utilization system XapX-like protein
MKRLRKVAALAAPAIALMGVCGAPTRAQAVPAVVPIVVDTAVPIVVNAVKPKPTGLSRFEGFVMNANAVQITVRDKSNELSIQTFTLSEVASTKMQQIVDKGGYQYGDKVTILYDPGSRKAVKVKGKPSRPI